MTPQTRRTPARPNTPATTQPIRPDTTVAPSDGDGASPDDGRESLDDGRESRRAAIDRLLHAASGLATTIAATEALTQRRADLLTRRSTLLGPVRDAGYQVPIISLAEAARRTGRHPEVLRRWCTEGRIPAVRIGRTWGITQETLATLLAHASRSRPRFPPSDSA